MRALLDYFLALPLALVPRRRWDDFDFPIHNVAFVSSLLTCLGGAALGIAGYFSHLADILAQREWTAPPMMIYVFAGYVFGTPRGLLSLYFTISGLLRAIAWFVDDAFGDPILTGIDMLLSRGRRSHRERSMRAAREKLEGNDEPDRRYDGAWAGLTGVDFVIVAARRKPEWDKGTWVITEEGWFILGEPFDRSTPSGLRTIYPLTLQNTLEAVRRSVQYELPPLRRQKAGIGNERGLSRI